MLAREISETHLEGEVHHRNVIAAELEAARAKRCRPRRTPVESAPAAARTARIASRQGTGPSSMSP
jgi:hypothetical protein